MDSAALPIESTAPVQVKCMEVWGGNGAAEHSFTRPGLDLWLWTNPKEGSERCGGDVHFLSSCASGRITRMLIADVCAQGAVYSEMADSLRQLMTENVNRIKQARFVKCMNHKLRDCACRGGFSTALIATYFAPTKSFSLCNTGHPPPFLFRAERREWSILKQMPSHLSDLSQVPPGLVDEGEYQQFDFRLGRHDMVLCYSNALTECRDAAGQFLGVAGLLKRISDVDPTRPAEISSTLVKSIKIENSDNLSETDATMMLCRATDNGVGWKDNLLAPFRLLRRVSDKTHIE